MTTFRVSRALRLLLALTGLIWSLSSAAAVCRVNANAISGSPDGQSWVTAYADLQTALHNASCTEVWVAQGAYLPVVPANTASVSDAERDTSFVIAPGVAVYGGFVGNESTRDARDPAAHVTVLSGDIDRNDAHAGGSDIDATPADIAGSNSLHVVVMDGVSGAPVGNDTVLDGFTVTGGDANSLSSAPNPLQTAGGGLFCNAVNLDPNASGHACSPTLGHLVFVGNRARSGGGMACMTLHGACSPVLDHVQFSNNTATGGSSTASGGGGLFLYEDGGSSHPVMTDLRFLQNDAGSSTSGGGISMFSSGGGTASLTRVFFSGNSGQFGGGLAIFGPNPVTSAAGAQLDVALTDVSFIGNRAAQLPPEQSGAGDGSGGGAYCLSCNMTLDNVTFTGNSASTGGGFALMGFSLPMSATLANVTFHDNTASKFGGALATGGTPRICPQLDHVTFHDDHAATTVQGSGFEVFLGAAGGSCSATFDNTILWNDAVQGVSLIYGSGSNVAINHGIVTGGCPNDPSNAVTYSCSDVLSGDPELGALTNNGGFTTTMLPGAGSAALDQATCSGPPTDQRGLPRPQGSACDLGAVERIVATTLDVAVTGSGHVDGSPSAPDLRVSGGITACSAAGGPACSADFAQHTLVTLVATADPHWHFVQWSGDCSGNGTSTSVTLDAAASCSATFAIDSLTVTSSAPGGHGSIAPATQSVDYDGTASFTLTPDAGYHVASVLGDTCTVSGSGNTWQAASIETDCAVTATFAINQYTLSYAAGAHGSISGAASQTVNYGADGSSVTAVPDLGYHFVGWSDGSVANPRLDAAVTADVDVSAAFAIDTFTVSASMVGGHGTIAPPSQAVAAGAVASFTVTPQTGYHVADIGGCGGTLTGATYTTAPVVAACAVTVRFAPTLPTYVAVPVLPRPWLLVFAGLLAGMGVAGLRRRQ